MRFGHFGLNRAIEFIEAFHHRRFGLRPVHACQSIVLSRLLVKPGIQNLHIFQHLVGRHTGHVVQREATLRARLPAGLHNQYDSQSFACAVISALKILETAA